jgi:hypothetical protein
VIKSSVAYVLCRIEDDSSLTLVSEHEELLSGIEAGKHMVEVEDHDYSYGLYTAELAVRVARFAEGRAGYREWARRRVSLYTRLTENHRLDAEFVQRSNQHADVVAENLVDLSHFAL